MSKNVAIGFLGVAVLVLAALLAQKGCDQAMPYVPPPEPPCEYLTVEFYVDTYGEAGEKAVFAKPEHLDDVKECALVIFSNQTDIPIKLQFLPSTSPTKSPFTGIETIELEAHGEKTQFSKGFPVAVELPDDENVELPDDENYLQYDYVVAEDGPPETEQSPRIRIGPRQATTRESD